MRVNKTILLTLGVTLGIGVALTGYASAASTETSFPPLVKGLVEKLNLNEDEVTNYLEEVRIEHQQARKLELQESLNKAKEEGKITQEQYETILAKHEELQASRETMYQNQGKVRGRQDNLREYLEEQNIEPGDVLPERKGPGPKGKQGLRLHQ